MEIKDRRIELVAPASSSLGLVALRAAAGGDSGLAAAMKTLPRQSSDRPFVDVGLRPVERRHPGFTEALHRPEPLAASASSVNVYDYGDGALKSFSNASMDFPDPAADRRLANPMYLNATDAGVPVLDVPTRTLVTFDTLRRIIAVATLAREDSGRPGSVRGWLRSIRYWQRDHHRGRPGCLPTTDSCNPGRA